MNLAAVQLNIQLRLRLHFQIINCSIISLLSAINVFNPFKKVEKTQ